MSEDAAAASTFSVDPNEVARFEAIADRWWDPDGPFWPLHGLNRYRVEYLRGRLPPMLGRDARAARPLDAIDTLDIGCGGGLLSEAIARLGAHVHGIDAVARNIAVAQRHRDAARDDPAVAAIRYEHLSVEALIQSGVQYDLLLNMEVVEHVREPERFLETCAQLLRPGGVMVVSTINRTAKSFLFAIVGAEYLLRLLPRGTHQWRKLVKPAQVRAALGRAGLHEQAAAGVRVDPFARTFRTVDSLAVNYMLTFRKCAG